MPCKQKKKKKGQKILPGPLLLRKTVTYCYCSGSPYQTEHWRNHLAPVVCGQLVQSRDFG